MLQRQRRLWLMEYFLLRVNMNARESLIIVNAVAGWGLSTLRKIIFPEADAGRSLPGEDICLDGIIRSMPAHHEESREKLLHHEKFFDLGKELTECDSSGIRIITCLDREYPRILIECHNAPLLLYVKGDFCFDDLQGIAVVGSRKCSAKGRSFACHISSQLASHGMTVISGLAFGIDAEAHRGALDGKGKTLAILGNGLPEVYPKEHAGLAEKICSQGAVISEFPLHAPSHKSNFPRRNRIISGLSLGVLVVEATQKSGSLITARYACEQGKEVFAVPGNPYDAYSSGTNSLIRDGAKLTATVEDILEEFTHLRLNKDEKISGASRPHNLTAEEQKILSALTFDPVSIEDLSSLSSLEIKNLSHILLTLELKKYIKVYPGNHFALNYRIHETQKELI
jgi:DNA processing protein